MPNHGDRSRSPRVHMIWDMSPSSLVRVKAVGRLQPRDGGLHHDADVPAPGRRLMVIKTTKLPRPTPVWLAVARSSAVVLKRALYVAGEVPWCRQSKSRPIGGELDSDGCKVLVLALCLHRETDPVRRQTLKLPGFRPPSEAPWTSEVALQADRAANGAAIAALAIELSVVYFGLELQALSNRVINVESGCERAVVLVGALDV